MKLKLSIVMSIILCIFLTACSNTGNTTINENHTNVVSSPSVVMNEYLAALSWNNIDQDINSRDIRIKITSDKLRIKNQIDKEYSVEWKDSFNSIINVCQQKPSSTYTAICDLANEVVNNHIIKTTILSKDENPVDNNTFQIKVIMNQTSYNLDTHNFVSNISTNVYILKNINNIWYVSDFVYENNTYFSDTYDIDTENKSTIDEITGLRELKAKIVESLTTQNNIESKLNAGIKSAIPDSPRVDINATFDNETNTSMVHIVYTFKEQALVDDYLQVQYDSANIFKEIFPIYPTIKTVKVTAKKSIIDDYGNPTLQYLSVITMNRDTYDKINWQYFEKDRLDKITSVSFYGDSFYKTIKDLKSNSNSYNYQALANPDVQSLCTDSKEECQTYGDCNTYDNMKTEGLCK